MSKDAKNAGSTSPKKKPSKKGETSDIVGKFQGDGISFKAKLYGTVDVNAARGDSMCQQALLSLKSAIKSNSHHKQKILIKITIDGSTLVDAASSKPIVKHKVNRISFISKDTSDSRSFSYIVGDDEGNHTLYGIKTDKPAEAVLLTFRDLFQAVVQLQKRQSSNRDSSRGSSVCEETDHRASTLSVGAETSSLPLNIPVDVLPPSSPLPKLADEDLSPIDNDRVGSIEAEKADHQSKETDAPNDLNTAVEEAEPLSALNEVAEESVVLQSTSLSHSSLKPQSEIDSNTGTVHPFISSQEIHMPSNLPSANFSSQVPTSLFTNDKSPAEPCHLATELMVSEQENDGPGVGMPTSTGIAVMCQRGKTIEVSNQQTNDETGEISNVPSSSPSIDDGAKASHLDEPTNTIEQTFQISKEIQISSSSPDQQLSVSSSELVVSDTTNPWGCAKPVDTLNPWTTFCDSDNTESNKMNNDPWANSSANVSSSITSESESSSQQPSKDLFISPVIPANSVLLNNPQAAESPVHQDENSFIKYDADEGASQTKMKSDSHETTDPFRTSDPFQSSDPFNTADPFQSSDPFNTTDPFPTSSLFSTPDKFPMADPFETSDPFLKSDPLLQNTKSESASTSHQFSSSDPFTTPQPSSLAESFSPSTSFQTPVSTHSSAPQIVAQSDSFTLSDPFQTARASSTSEPVASSKSPRTSARATTSGKFNSSDKVITSDPIQTTGNLSVPVPMSDTACPSILDSTSCPFPISEPLETSNPFDSSDPFTSVDPFPVADPFTSSDPFSVIDPFQMSDPFRKSEVSDNVPASETLQTTDTTKPTDPIQSLSSLNSFTLLNSFKNSDTVPHTQVTNQGDMSAVKARKSEESASKLSPSTSTILDASCGSDIVTFKAEDLNTLEGADSSTLSFAPPSCPAPTLPPDILASINAQKELSTAIAASVKNKQSPPAIPARRPPSQSLPLVPARRRSSSMTSPEAELSLSPAPSFPPPQLLHSAISTEPPKIPARKLLKNTEPTESS
ncbi:disabled homolog 1-like [Watersipora subatra]|uniref:disabled homolog 1-like n=1 Tax=Watersipora subatra TaxID=2589382 RepID=UPI00355C6BF0